MYFLIENQPKIGNRYQFKVMEKNDSILISEPFLCKEDCLRAISATRRHGPVVENYSTWDLPGDLRFNLYIKNDSLLKGTQRYKSIEERDLALQQVADHISLAPTRDMAPDLAMAA
ncbi:hypothetical protein [Larkinella terrae]|uniref:DUF1508 domain-containing protein n=1 Tax=Larkinella terrae TaxID=2025311 RepID=A0A7K0EKW4_9BACT|nr:hypothetical protein [Larkinella terrae]MRS62098.1 hypothetical protein [Larkinella terrae]